METLAELLTQQEKDAIRAPIEPVRTLPRKAFIDPDFYAYEVRQW